MAQGADGAKAAGAGAVVSAALASMCCILPLGLGALGLSSTALSAFFAPLRPYFLALAGVLLALGFYSSFRASRTAAAVCATDSGRVSRLSRPTLWIATAAVLSLALFPSLAGTASGGGAELRSEVASEVVVLRVEGMTCAACAPEIRSELLDVPGVIDAAVSYEQATAEVRIRTEKRPADATLLAAVERAGYSAQVTER